MTDVGSVDERGGDPALRVVALGVERSPDSLRVVRLVAGDAAGRAGFTIDRVQGTTVVVDELVAILVAVGTSATIELTVGYSPSVVRLEGSVGAAGADEPEVDVAVRQLLDLSVGRSGHWSLEARDGRLRFLAEIRP